MDKTRQDQVDNLVTSRLRDEESRRALHGKFVASVTSSLKAKGLIRDEDGVPKQPDARQIEIDQLRAEGFKQGYQQALNDMKKQLEELQQRRRGIV
jgi:hypothetical protein